MELLSSIIIGVSLAAACGFRVFVPMLVMSIAAHGGHVTLAPELEWIGSYPAILAFGIATALEIGGYYIPWLDNLLDSLATPAAIVAGTIVVGGVVTDMEPLFKWAIALVAGGGTAGAVQGVTVLARGASSLATGGLGNPAVSTAEAGGSLVTATLAVFLPFLAIALVVVFLAGTGFFIIRRRKRKRHGNEQGFSGNNRTR